MILISQPSCADAVFLWKDCKNQSKGIERTLYVHKTYQLVRIWFPTCWIASLGICDHSLCTFSSTFWLPFCKCSCLLHNKGHQVHEEDQGTHGRQILHPCWFRTGGLLHLIQPKTQLNNSKPSIYLAQENESSFIKSKKRNNFISYSNI